ncbi:MAG TPA: FAD-dependent oxidoreductase [Solirubrobacterales bacterium]|nr:FAD-dependent oxidoreductase [Solirubrobacterales bacterium]
MSLNSIYWRETEPVQPGPPLLGERRCDVCIVGAGYTGLWTAHQLKLAEPSLDVCVLEAAYAGAGASGHNDGFVTPTIGHGLHNVVRRFGAERAKAAYAAVGRSILELRRFCRKQGVEAELEPNGFLTVAVNAGQRRRLEADVATAAEMGVGYELLSAEETRSRVGSAEPVAALELPGALVNPHKLARGLARVVREQGVEVYEGSPVVALELGTGSRVAKTPGGQVVADRIVLATNAYQHRLPGFRRKVKPVWSYAMVSEPLGNRFAELGWSSRQGFVEARNFILFARPVAEDRILIGGGPAPYRYGRDMDDSHMRDKQVFKQLREALTGYFPSLAGLRFTHAYGGCIAVTRDLVPHVGELEPGVFYAYGYCGNGIAMTHAAAKALRDLVLEVDSDHARQLYVRDRTAGFPPEPLAFLGARALSALLRFQDAHPALLQRQIV